MDRIFVVGYSGPLGIFDDNSNGNATSGLPKSSSAGRRALVMKLHSNGEYAWHRTFGSSSKNTATSIALASTGHLVVAGTFADELEDQGELCPAVNTLAVTAGFISVWDTDGTCLSMTAYEPTGDEEGRRMKINGLALLPNDQPVITGQLVGHFEDFYPGKSNSCLSPTGPFLAILSALPALSVTE